MLRNFVPIFKCDPLRGSLHTRKIRKEHGPKSQSWSHEQKTSITDSSSSVPIPAKYLVLGVEPVGGCRRSPSHVSRPSG